MKLVAETGVGTIAAGVAKAKADMILISGCEGGTGASPSSSIKHAGLPVELGLSETQQVLVMNNLRDKVRLQTDGQLKTGLDVIRMGLLGAEEFGFSTSSLIVLGCIMMRKCHLNTCPVGVATQDERLRKHFMGKAEYLLNFFNFIAEDIREHLAALGFTKFDNIVGRTDLLTFKPQPDHWKAKNISLEQILYVPDEVKINRICCAKMQNHKLEEVMDQELIKVAQPAINNLQKVFLEREIKNVDRTVGAMLSGVVAKKYGNNGLPEDTINFTFKGSAGQSFGAFLARGITLKLEGDANDYLGKGLSGGKIIVVPPKGITYKPEENVIIGNTVLYGATSGEVYINGTAGERFCVRNSGVTAVVEGAGDHCCEYMTGGRTVILGSTGRNFAAGMSGGIAYVLNVDGNFDYFCNMGMVELTLLEDMYDQKELKELISRHFHYTESPLAKKILDNWANYVTEFIKVTPIEYKKVLEEERIEAIKKKIANVEFDY